MKTQPIAKGYNTLSPYLTVIGAVKAINFYKKAFGAVETGRITMPDGTVSHCEMDLGSSKLMIAEENKQWGNLSPETLGGSPVHLCLYVEDVDAVFDRALKEGAKVLGEMVVKDQFYGDRTGTLTDPFGHKWTIMTHLVDLSYTEMQRLSDEMFLKNN
jgi:PhnB protein